MILIKNINIIDGSGKPAFKGDILIKDDKISAIGTFPNKQAEIIIDGLGLTATPGFIDVNNDSDHYLGLFTNPSQDDFLLQGVTTIIGGQCGSSLAPLLYGSLKSIRKWTDTDEVNVDWRTIGELKNTLRRIGIGVNFATLIGHSTIRRDLIGEEIRDLTETETQIFQNAVEQAMKEGALGLSTGLGYAHSRNVPYSEIKKLLKVAAKYKAVYASHLRDEKKEIAKSVEEIIRLSKEAEIPAVISHLRPILGLEKEFQDAFALINQNLQEQNVYFDVNPFPMSVFPIYTFLPAWAQAGGLETMLEILGDKNHRSKIIQDLTGDQNELEKLTIASAQDSPYIVGKSLKEFSENRGLDIKEGLLALMEITRLKSLLFYKNINSEILAGLLFHPRSFIGSNGASVGKSKTILKVERATNTFARFLEIAKAKNISQEETVKKITSSPAKFFNLAKRGYLREGAVADLAIMKDGKIAHVLVNGKISVQDGQVTKVRNGMPL